MFCTTEDICTHVEYINITLNHIVWQKPLLRYNIHAIEIIGLTKFVVNFTCLPLSHPKL